VALFIYSVAGNVAYVASILVKDMGRKHLIANASWLLGISPFSEPVHICLSLDRKRRDSMFRYDCNVSSILLICLIKLKSFQVAIQYFYYREARKEDALKAARGIQ
jgi:hypothetical protein